ncbi:MAG: ion transporter [Chromatiales bacterium]|nr:ion transporter [Chromatiales bacterium]
MVVIFNKVRESKIFQFVVVALIIASALLIGADTFDLATQYKIIIALLSEVITIFFLIELIIRFIGEPHKNSFFRDGWNLFDTIVVGVSLIPIGPGSAILIARLLRVFRVLRIISVMPELKILIECLLKSLPRILYTSLLLFIIMYIYAATGSLLFESTDAERWQDIATALFTLTQVLTLSSWEQVFLPLQAVHWWAWIYLYSFIAIGSITILNLIIAVLVDVVMELKQEQR